MDLALTEEQEMLKTAVRRFVQQEYPKDLPPKWIWGQFGSPKFSNFVTEQSPSDPRHAEELGVTS